ncbi:hypothetical protein R1sor_004976 [Riccia sorocarpa]|uniref:Uncharacterized protein n=1 Tax=Riccia sorocarpa TaxID=122646 RepID=A0ABD3HMJ6_9MARC
MEVSNLQDRGHKEVVERNDAGGPACCLHRAVSPASSSSSSNSEMKPRAMARSLWAQKNSSRHRMTKQDYEMIVTYLENPDNFAAINDCVFSSVNCVNSVLG